MFYIYQRLQNAAFGDGGGTLWVCSLL